MANNGYTFARWNGHEHAHHGTFDSYVSVRTIGNCETIFDHRYGVAMIGGILHCCSALQSRFSDANLSCVKALLGGWLTPEGKWSRILSGIGNDARTIMVFLYWQQLEWDNSVTSWFHCKWSERHGLRFMNMLSYWFFFASSCVMFTSLLFQLDLLPVVG